MVGASTTKKMEEGFGKEKETDHKHRMQHYATRQPEQQYRMKIGEPAAAEPAASYKQLLAAVSRLQHKPSTFPKKGKKEMKNDKRSWMQNLKQ